MGRPDHSNAKEKTMSKERQFTAHDAVESKQTGDIQLDKTSAELTEKDLQESVGGVRTTGVDEVGLLTENRQPNKKPPTGGQIADS
jgi:hypothetical protein